MQFDASNRLPSDAYTVQMVFELDGGDDSFRRVLETADRGSDDGAYIYPDGSLDVWPQGSAGSSPKWQSNAFQRVVLVNDAGDTVRLYLEGTLVRQVSSPALDISGPRELLSFWLDNTTNGADYEYRSGRVAFLRIWDRPLTPAEVAALDVPLQQRGCGDALDVDCDGLPNGLDFCPFFSSFNQSDADANTIGDVCECGDQTRDGTVNVLDIVGINSAIFGAVPVSPLCDANGDGLCNVSDMVAVNLKIFGRPAYCVRYPISPVSLVVGSQQFDIRRAPTRLFESAMGNMVADTMLQKYPGADAALVNSGGLRADLLVSSASAGEQPGEITWGELFTVLPFGNRTALVTLTGADLKTALLNGLSPYCNPGISTGRFPQVSALSLTFLCNGTVPVITSLSLNGVAVGPTDAVRIVTIDFLLAGGDGYTVLAQGTDIALPGDLLHQIVVEYVATHSPVGPVVEGRIVPEPD